MKIVFCIDNIIEIGGMQKVLFQRTNYLIERFDYEITIITTEHNIKKYIGINPFYEFNSKIKIINLDIRYSEKEDNNLSYFKKKVIIEKKKRKHIKLLRKVLYKREPDIVISFGELERLFLYKIKGKFKKIVEHHVNKANFVNVENEKNNLLKKIKYLYRNYREKKLINKYDKFLVLTEEDKKDWADDRIKVIHNPLSFSSNQFSDYKNKKIISVGRLDYQKGYDILISVWNKISKKYPDWSLEVYGEGVEREKLQNKINELNLNSSFLLKGAVKNIYEKYLESSIYIMSSRYEGMPMVLLEAMSFGLPVISFDCPCGPKDIIKDNEDGFIIKFGNIEQMAEKIEELINDEEKRKLFGINAKKNIQRFSEEKIMNQWKELFEKLVRNK